MVSQRTATAAARKRNALRTQKIDENPPRCAFGSCGRVIPPPRRYSQNIKYCSPACSDRAAAERQTQKATMRRVEHRDLKPSDLYPEHKVRRGPLLDKIRAELTAREYEEWIEQSFADALVSQRLGAYSASAVGMARRAAWNDKVLAAQAQVFRPKERHLRMLGPSDSDMRQTLANDPDLYERLLDKLVDSFVEWRDEFFKATSEGTYITKPFHRDWIRATLHTIYTGGRQLILSPPRHGKTDLLIHFCVWLILRDPMIRILWVGPNDDIAQNSLGQVRNLLETHDELREAYLGPNVTWAPAKRSSSATWQASKFTVATRPQPRKQPTMWCTGVKSKITSLDADFIIVDDPADPDDSNTEGGRELIYNWFRKKLLTRKMHFTGLVMISSRVHPSDLYSNYIDSVHWKVIVNRAHNGEVCSLDMFDSHPSNECILFPEMNPLDYLRLQSDDVGPDLFDMMYQNQPRPDGTMIFDPEVIRDRCLDRSRGLGLLGLPHPYRLVGGLDPAARGVQAAFLWAVRLPSFYSDYDASDVRWKDRKIESYYMVDMETQSAGGIEGAVKIMRDWFVRYGVELWVVEDNSYQKVFFDDPRVKALKAELGLDIRPTHSGGQTYDQNFGVSSLAPLYHEGKIILPYATSEAQRKVNALITQLTNFTNERAKKPGKSDILMASWFPFPTVIKRWRRADNQASVSQTTPVSYPGYVSSTPNTLPWQPLQYPSVN